MSKQSSSRLLPDRVEELAGMSSWHNIPKTHTHMLYIHTPGLFSVAIGWPCGHGSVFGKLRLAAGRQMASFWTFVLIIFRFVVKSGWGS